MTERFQKEQYLQRNINEQVQNAAKAAINHAIIEINRVLKPMRQWYHFYFIKIYLYIVIEKEIDLDLQTRK